MKCYLCKGKASIKQQKGRSICNRCFCKLIEKRVRKYSRINKLFKKNDRILVLGNVSRYFLESMLKGLPVKLFFRKNNVNKVVVEWTMDDEVNEFMKALFLGKKMKKAKKNEIKLLKVLTDDEVKKFAKIKKLKFKVNKRDKDVQKFLDNVEKKHPNIKYNLLKNINVLNRLT
ncbi:hypothetical protein GOV06_00120 [Candidatus Woesearchaeota archaeon]|nr:hypothetical protein [Candidatus Woesearchaeota archaeon]